MLILVLESFKIIKYEYKSIVETKLNGNISGSLF